MGNDRVNFTPLQESRLRISKFKLEIVKLQSKGLLTSHEYNIVLSELLSDNLRRYYRPRRKREL